MIYFALAVIAGYAVLCIIERKIIVPGFAPLVVSSAVGLAILTLFSYALSCLVGRGLLAVLPFPVVAVAALVAQLVFGGTECRRVSRWRPIFDRRSEKTVFIVIVVLVLGMVACLYRPLLAPVEEKGMVAAFPGVPDVHKQIAICASVGTLRGGNARPANPFIAGAPLSYYILYYLPASALHLFSDIPINISYALVSIFTGFLFISLFSLYARRLLESGRGALAALAFITLVGGMDLVMHTLSGSPATMGLEGWQHSTALGIPLTGARTPLNLFSYVPQHLFAGTIALTVFFLLSFRRMNGVLCAVTVLLVVALWGSSFYVAIPFSAGLAVYAAYYGLSRGGRRAYAERGGRPALLLVTLLASAALSAILIISLVNLPRAGAELSGGGFNPLKLFLPLLISYPLKPGAIYILGLCGLYLGWKQGLFERSGPWPLLLIMVGASLFLASIPGRTLDWQINGLLPAQIGLAVLAGLAAGGERRHGPKGRLGKAALLGLKGVIWAMITLGAATTIFQFIRLLPPERIPADRYRLLRWIDEETEEDALIAVFDNPSDSLGYWIPVLSHRPRLLELDQGFRYSDSRERALRTLEDLERMRCELDLGELHDGLSNYGVGYLAVRRGLSFYDAYEREGLSGTVRAYFSPVAGSGEYTLFRLRQPPGKDGKETVEFAFGGNLLPPLPAGASGDGWVLSSDTGRAETSPGDSGSPAVLFTGGGSHAIRSARPLTLKEGETYLVELRIAARGGDEYTFSFSLDDAERGKKKVLKFFEGEGHDRIRFTTLFTPDRDMQAAVDLRIETFSPNQNPLVDGLSIRPVRLLPSKKGTGS